MGRKFSYGRLKFAFAGSTPNTKGLTVPGTVDVIATSGKPPMSRPATCASHSDKFVHVVLSSILLFAIAWSSHFRLELFRLSITLSNTQYVGEILQRTGASSLLPFCQTLRQTVQPPSMSRRATMTTSCATDSIVDR